MSNLINIVDTLQMSVCTNSQKVLTEAAKEPACRFYLDNVLIVLTIAITVCIVVSIIAFTVYKIIHQRKEDGVKKIVENLLKDKVKDLVTNQLKEQAENRVQSMSEDILNKKIEDLVKNLVREESLKNTGKPDKDSV